MQVQAPMFGAATSCHSDALTLRFATLLLLLLVLWGNQEQLRTKQLEASTLQTDNRRLAEALAEQVDCVKYWHGTGRRLTSLPAFLVVLLWATAEARAPRHRAWTSAKDCRPDDAAQDR
jgi:hypothetical protein